MCCLVRHGRWLATEAESRVLLAHGGVPARTPRPARALEVRRMSCLVGHGRWLAAARRSDLVNSVPSVATTQTRPVARPRPRVLVSAWANASYCVRSNCSKRLARVVCAARLGGD